MTETDSVTFAVAQEQLPIYNKATEVATGTSNENQSGNAEGTATSAKVESLQPPASNPGADDPTGGIGEGAGGLSSTAHIESPVPNNDQSLFSTVKNMLGFGTTEEVKAEDKGPAENATTASPSSLLAESAVAAPIAAATSSLTSSGPATTTTATSSDPAATAGTGKGTYLDYQQAANTDSSSAFPSSQTLPIRSTPGGSLPSENTSAAANTDTTSKSTEAVADNTPSKTSDDGNKMGESGEKQERAEPDGHKPPKPADGKPDGEEGKKKGLENKDAIPTAGGKTLGQEHWGESNIVPDDPKAAKETESMLSHHNHREILLIASLQAKPRITLPRTPAARREDHMTRAAKRERARRERARRNSWTR